MRYHRSKDKDNADFLDIVMPPLSKNDEDDIDVMDEIKLLLFIGSIVGGWLLVFYLFGYFN